METTLRFDGDDEAFRQASRRFGELIARTREALEMTREELARAAHASPRTVERVEAGDIGKLTIGTIERIAAAVGIELDIDVVPRVEELEIIASTTPAPIRVFAGNRGRRGNRARRMEAS